MAEEHNLKDFTLLSDDDGGIGIGPDGTLRVIAPDKLPEYKERQRLRHLMESGEIPYDPAIYEADDEEFYERGI